MNFWNPITILTTLLLILSGPGTLGCAPAWGDEQLDDVLKGFEDDQAQKVQPKKKLKKSGAKTEPHPKSNGMTGDEVLEGFDDAAEEPAGGGTKKQVLPQWLSLDGYLKLSSVYSYLPHGAEATGTDWHGLTRLRPELKLDFKSELSKNWQARISGHAYYDLAYAINGRSDYSDEVLAAYESELELDEAYLQGNLTKNFDLKTGRQIVVWGRSDSIRITDVLNPLDTRWPGLVDIEKLRLPITMTRVDYYLKDWHLTAIALHEVRYNKRPAFGSDFFPAVRPLPEEESPDEGFSAGNTQFAAAINGIFSGWDMSVYFADIYDRNGHLKEGESSGPLSVIAHSRIKMIGGAVNVVRGNWLIKSEAAYFDGFEFTNTHGRKFSRLDALAGVEYSGISDATITLEVANRHYFDFDNALEDPPDYQKQDLFEWALRITKPFLNDTLTLTFLSTLFGPTGQDGGFQRMAAEYDLTDSIELSGGIVLYQSGDLRRTRGIEDNDRIFFEVQYHF